MGKHCFSVKLILFLVGENTMPFLLYFFRIKKRRKSQENEIKALAKLHGDFEKLNVEHKLPLLFAREVYFVKQIKTGETEEKSIGIYMYIDFIRFETCER